MNRKELIKKYLDFFQSKNHKIIKNSSLIPENDPTVLFTTAGMHPLVPFLSGQAHLSGKRLVNVQRCIRTGDIEKVGNTTHHTFFEMLGNWSLGDYFKEDAIKYSFEFLTKILNIPIENLAISVFSGDKNSPRDYEAAKVWQDLGIPKVRIAYLSKRDNWWDPTGNTGPCGPDTEMFYWKLKNKKPPKIFDPNNENWIEIWNDVLMQYNKDDNGNYNEAKQKNIDTGMGVERTIAVLNGLEDNYLIDAWQPIIKTIQKLSKKDYNNNKKEMRIIADHIKASVFIIADGISPSNTEQGYVLRRLIRRAIMNLKKLNISSNNNLTKIAEPIFSIYDDYDHLKQNKENILKVLEDEEEQFAITLEKGLREFNKIAKTKKISGKQAFLLFQSYGFPYEMTIELAKEKNIPINEKEFEKEKEKHQILSRTSTQGKFKSGLADNSVETTKLHTATHLLNEALRIALNDNSIEQKGSNITKERLRFDFNFPRKLSPEEIKKVEELVNKKIKEAIPITKEEMTVDQAKKARAQGLFKDKYKSKISVYTIGKFSKEICTGPHVKNTKDIGTFKITKEESSSKGIRRIKATVV